ncbi:MAG: hypothetical protein WDO24_30375 [Pseudomonadota bacterium]
MLEELGYVRSETASGTKRLYTITDEGRAFLLANQTAGRLDPRAHGRADPGPMAAGRPPRSCGRCKLALSIRLGRGPLNPEQVRAITTVLDRVAGEIEAS